MIGRTLSHYRILEEISRGGMGIVYRALDLNLEREVALKVLPPELVADQERKRRFVQEAKAAAVLEHPNIAVVYEIDEFEGENFVVMELIHGEMLRDAFQLKRPEHAWSANGRSARLIATARFGGGGPLIAPAACGRAPVPQSGWIPGVPGTA